MSNNNLSSVPAAELPVVRLKINRRSSHPWIYQKMVEKPKQRLRPGSVVDIEDRDGNWVGRGFYNGHSRITLRVLTGKKSQPIDEQFFRYHLDEAIQLRRKFLNLDEVTNAYRLVHSEGDRLSGLVVDRFGSMLVVEYFSAGMFRFRETIHGILKLHYPNSELYWFAEEHVQKQESFDCHAPDPPQPISIQEHGLRFHVTPGSKHKTGFFVDQRDNRKLMAELCRGKRVLDICCNSGGFSVYAKTLGQAEETTGIDLDEQAIELAKQNANLNQARIRFVQADLFSWLRDIIPQGKQFDVVILDPSKQTRSRESVGLALKRYRDMNQLAIRVVSPGGLLLTCSCTGLVKEDEFLDTLRTAAWLAERQLQVLRITGAGADHPFVVHAQEGRYLKAVLCRVI